MSQDAKVDKLVLEYLEKRGLLATSRQLKAESQSLSQQMSLGPNRGSNGVVSDLLFYISAEGKPSYFSKSFDSLASWVDNSLDLYRYELSQVLYPIFIHCCLKLVSNEATSEATQLIGRHSQRFTSIGGQPSKIRLQELTELQAITVPEHLVTNRLAQAVQKTRYPISLSMYSHELLMQFLQGSRLFLILGIVNENLNIQVTEGQPKSLPDDAEKEISLLSGLMEADVSKGNLSSIQLNLLQGSAEDKYALAKAAEQAMDIPELDEDGKPLRKKDRLARQKAATKERDSLAAVEADRMEAEIPLPMVSEDLREEQMADIEARVKLSSNALPSAAFFTFINTNHSLNCVAFSHSRSQIAGGFSDASVRVYDLSQTCNRGGEGGAEDDSARGMTHFYGHSGAVYGADFSSDGELLYSASADGTLRLWHLKLEACLNMYRGHNFPVWDVAANPLGQYFASAAADRTARLWSVERNQPLRIFTGHYSDVDVLQWHPNAHYLGSGSSDHTVRLWDVRDGDAKRVLIGHRAAITALAFHPSGATLSSADEDGVIITWDLASAKKVATGVKHRGPIWSLAYSSGEGALLASGGSDDSVRLWDATTEGKSDLQLLKTFRTKATAVYSAVFSPRNLLLASGARIMSKKHRG